MKNVLQLLALTFTFLSSCQKEYSAGDSGAPFSYDADAQKFIESATITDGTQKVAINNFVIQLKSLSLWKKFKAIYPMIGGSAAATKWNLKDPRDLDAAYRLTFYGSPVFALSGVLFPTPFDYADSHLPDNAIGNYNDASISYYSMTQNTIDGYDMGCVDNVSPNNELTIYHHYDATDWFGYNAWGLTPSNTRGLFMLSATSNDVKRYENGTVTDSKGSPPAMGFTNMPVLIGSPANAPVVGQRECGLATIGNGLTDAEALTFYNLVKDFETALGR